MVTLEIKNYILKKKTKKDVELHVALSTRTINSLSGH